MIAKDFITEWRGMAPWVADSQVEQDLVISRALVELFSDPLIAGALAFRGGTALYKLYVKPAARYSEDIDLVQTRAEPIGPVLDAIRNRLDAWLGTPARKAGGKLATLTYRFESEDPTPVRMKLKVETNTREHQSAHGYVTQRFEVASRYFNGGADIRTYQPDELLGTKLRALYQRKKSRDLFDLWLALDRQLVSPTRVVDAFTHYMRNEPLLTRAMFEKNLRGKRTDPAFTVDMGPLLAPGQTWEFDVAFERVMDEVIALLPG